MTDNPAKFTVFVDDNYHYQDETERYKLGEFESYEEAVRQAKKIVDEFLGSDPQKGKTSDTLLSEYKRYGEDPWITPEPEGQHFSAWSYAEERCKILCKS